MSEDEIKLIVGNTAISAENMSQRFFSLDDVRDAIRKRKEAIISVVRVPRPANQHLKIRAPQLMQAPGSGRSRSI